MYDADDVEYRVVLYKFEGEYYCSAFQLYEYDGRWLISGYGEALAEIPYTVTFGKLFSKSEYDSMLGK